jgi:hypothetical protein
VSSLGIKKIYNGGVGEEKEKKERGGCWELSQSPPHFSFIQIEGWDREREKNEIEKSDYSKICGRVY